MAFIADRVLDNGLTVLDTESNALHICSQEPTTFAQATTTYSLGSKSLGAGDIGAPTARTPSGRKVVVGALSGGTVSGNGTASHWAIVDTVNSRLLATGSLSASQAVTSDNQFSLASFDIGIPGAA